MTRTPGKSARNRRLASMPSIPGRLTSIRTRSGSNSATAASPSSAVGTAPTTTKESVHSTTVAAARRNGTWSSTIKTLTFVIVDHLPPLWSLCPWFLRHPWLLRQRSRQQVVGRTPRGGYPPPRSGGGELLQRQHLGGDHPLNLGWVDTLVGGVDAGERGVLRAPEDHVGPWAGVLQRVDQRDRAAGADRLDRRTERLGQPGLGRQHRRAVHVDRKRPARLDRGDLHLDVPRGD